MKATSLLLTLFTLSFAATAATISDDLGNNIALEKPARRVIALSPHTAELLIAAGGAPYLVAAPAQTAGLPPHTQHINTLGGIDRERLVQLKPDLVLAWASGNRASDLAWLEKTGIPVYRSEPRSMQNIADGISAIGQLVGQPVQGRKAAANFLQRLQDVCRGLEKEEVYVSIWDQPAMTVGGRHWLNDALTHAKLVNTFGTQQRGVFAVEREARMTREELAQVLPRAPTATLSGDQLAIAGLSRPGPALARAIEKLCRSRQLSSE